MTRPMLAGLVLCGGAGRRMGGDKTLVAFEGEPLVLRVARRLVEVADPVLLAPGRPGRLGDLGYREVADAAANAGPLGGLVAGLDASPHELVAVVGVDMPFASSRVFDLLARRHTDEDVVVPIVAQAPEPLHAVYARSAIPKLQAALEERRLALRDVLRTLRVLEIGEADWRTADPTGMFAHNVNRPEDLSVTASSRILGGRTDTDE